MSKVITYVDGFNLYNGLRSKYSKRYLWLDLEALSRSLLNPGQTLEKVHYFTAAVRDRPDSLRRQQRYWNALHVQAPRVHVHQGRFQKKSLSCRSCGTSWRSFEEKETDVGIAVRLVEDAALKRFDTALIVSADSDLCPAVAAVRRLHPKAKVVAAFPPDRNSGELRNIVDAAFTIARTKIVDSQLPNPVKPPLGGAAFWCPPSWK